MVNKTALNPQALQITVLQLVIRAEYNRWAARQRCGRNTLSKVPGSGWCRPAD